MDAVKIGPKHQVTIPQEVFGELKLKVGEFLQVFLKDGVLHMVPVKLIPKNQLWFWTEEWQKKEREANKDIEEGRVKEFKSIKELVEELNA